MAAYNFTPKGAYFVSFKPINPDNKDVAEAFSRFYISIGSLATIVQTQIVDTHNYLKEHKELYKREVKFFIKQANERIDNMIAVFKKYTMDASSYTMWLDITDKMEEILKTDVQKAFYSLDNHLLRYASGGDHKLVAHALLAYNLSAALSAFTNNYVNRVMKNNPNIPSSLAPSPEYCNTAKGTAGSMMELCKVLLPNEKFSQEEFTYVGCEQLALSMDIILKSLMDNDNIAESCDQSLEYGNVDPKFIHDDVSTENSLVNQGTLWNDTQIAVLKAFYKKSSDEQIAAMIGRSVGAIKAKMRQLKLKRTE